MLWLTSTLVAAFLSLMAGGSQSPPGHPPPTSFLQRGGCGQEEGGANAAEIVYGCGMEISGLHILPQSGTGDRGAFLPPRVRGITISCHHGRIDRDTAEVKPSACDLVGPEFVGGKMRGFPIQKLRWNEWGKFRSEGTYGVNIATGSRVRVFAFDRKHCADGRVFYSLAGIRDLQKGAYSVIRLPPSCQTTARVLRREVRSSRTRPRRTGARSHEHRRKHRGRKNR